MTEYFNGRRARPRARTRSLCARCGKLREEPHDMSPGRSSWAEKGRGLSIEMDGREGRRRHSSSENTAGNQKVSSMHCYILPISNSSNAPFTRTSTTYRESFRLPANQGFSRYATSAPSSPLSSSPLWQSQSSQRSTQNSTSRHSFSQSDAQANVPSMPSRSGSRDNSWSRSNTTYRDHFTWMS